MISMKYTYKKWRAILFLSVSVSLFTADSTAQIAELHIIAEPGVRLFTDNEFFTQTDSAHTEAVIGEISAESHQLTCSKEGCFSIAANIDVRRSHTTYYIAHKLICSDSITGEFMRYEGTEPSCLTVRSYPSEVHFSIPQYSIISDKVGETWVANNIPSGPCDIYFQYHDTDIITTVDIIPGTQSYLFIDLNAHTVLDSIIDPCTCCTPDSIGYMSIIGELEPHIVEEVFEPWEVTAQANFNGGLSAMEKFVEENIQFPQEALQAAKKGNAEVSGQTMVEFIVEHDGMVVDETVRVIGKHSGFGIEEAIIKSIVKSSGMWTPGKIEDREVRQKIRIPVGLVN